MLQYFAHKKCMQKTAVQLYRHKNMPSSMLSIKKKTYEKNAEKN